MNHRLILNVAEASRDRRRRFLYQPGWAAGLILSMRIVVVRLVPKVGLVGFIVVEGLKCHRRSGGCGS